MCTDARGEQAKPLSRLCPAILLLGPTGSGKTPLGELLEAEGLWGRRCVHFDFGMNLRQYASGGEARDVLTRGEREFLVRVLESGALLEDEHFPIARKVLLGFLSSRGAGSDSLVALNGLPRHVGQARAMEALVSMEMVVHLACEPEVAAERIRTDAGGDRRARADDGIAGVRKRIEVFRQRTAPLLGYYGSRGVSVLRVDVGPRTTPSEVRAELERSRDCGGRCGVAVYV
ncbi:MAG: nucleoside monophosphate kinase [Planctomycetota bacterium]|nr:nucleoside monophosphate kinase [Planctomycetota bacterium]